MAGNPISYLHSKLGGWGTNGLSHLEPEALQAYEQGFHARSNLPACATITEPGAGIDLDHESRQPRTG